MAAPPASPSTSMSRIRRSRRHHPLSRARPSRSPRASSSATRPHKKAPAGDSGCGLVDADVSRGSIDGDGEDLEVAGDAEVVIAGFALHVLGLVDARAFRLLLEGTALTAPRGDNLLELGGFLVRDLRVGEGGGAAHAERERGH